MACFLVLTLLSRMPSASAAGNATCPHGANTTSSACIFGSPQAGDYAEFHNNNMTVTSAYEAAGYHVNHSLWSYSGPACNASPAYWVEEGITQGYHGQIAYLWYYAASTSSGYSDFPAGYTTPDGTNHTYLLHQASPGHYSVWRDSTNIANFTGLGTNICMGQTGLEISSGYSTLNQFHSDQFDITNLQWQSLDNVWHPTGWPTSMFWVDYPCSAYPAHYCTNQNYRSTTHWTDSKP